MLNQFRVKDNARGQFQIRMTTEDGTITCVVSPHLEAGLLAQRRDTALRRAKRLAQQLDEAIKLPGAGPVTLRGHHPAANTPVSD